MIFDQFVSRLCYNSEMFYLIHVVLTIKLLQNNYEITLDEVSCSSAEWESCSFTEEITYCNHRKDVFLSCSSAGEKLTNIYLFIDWCGILPEI